MEDKSFDMAISLTDLKLVDTYFHTNQPTESQLQSHISVSLPNAQFNTDKENGLLGLDALVSVQFILFNGDVPAAISQDDLNSAVISYGIALGVTVTAPLMGDAIAVGKHAVRGEDDLETERDKRMERNMKLEAVRAAYGMASSRLLELSSLSPFGGIHMPLVDADELLRDIEQRDRQ